MLNICIYGIYSMNGIYGMNTVSDLYSNKIKGCK